MEGQVLTREQMRELISLGVDTSDASMVWTCYPNGLFESDGVNYQLEINDYEPKKVEDPDVPAFTFLDIRKQLPKFINVGDDTYFLTLMYDVSEGVVVSYCTEHINKILHSEGSSSEIEAMFKMLKWVKEELK